jgi:hypothetical protein
LARDRGDREVGLLGGPVLRLPLPALEVAQEGGPGLLRLVDEEHVAAAAQLLGTQRCERPSDHHEAAAPAELRDDLEHALLVDDVARHADQVGLEIEVDRLDVLVAEHDLVLAGGETRDRRHRQVGEDAALAERRKYAVIGPEAGRVLGSHQVDLQGTSSAPWPAAGERAGPPPGRLSKFGEG